MSSSDSFQQLWDEFFVNYPKLASSKPIMQVYEIWKLKGNMGPFLQTQAKKCSRWKTHKLSQQLFKANCVMEANEWVPCSECQLLARSVFNRCRKYNVDNESIRFILSCIGEAQYPWVES